MRGGFEFDLRVGEDGSEALEALAPPRDHGIEAVDRFDLREAVVALRLLRRAHLPQHEVAGAETIPPDLGLGDIRVGHAARASVVAEEAVAVRQHFQHAAGELVPLALRPRREHPVEKGVVGPGRRTFPLRLHLVEECEQLLRGLGLEFREVHGAPSPVLCDARARASRALRHRDMHTGEWCMGRRWGLYCLAGSVGLARSRMHPNDALTVPVYPAPPIQFNPCAPPISVIIIPRRAQGSRGISPALERPPSLFLSVDSSVLSLILHF